MNIFRRKKNDVKEFVDYVSKNEYLQTRQTKSDGASLARYLRELADDMTDGVIVPINFIEDIVGDDADKFFKGKNGHPMQVRGKKRIALIYYEYAVV